jgi:glutamate-1-semialdehyde 2,1-aminomutase
LKLPAPSPYSQLQEKQVKHADHSRLLAELAADYARHSPRSAALQQRALQVLVDGGSHSLRLIEPFPPRITAAKGSRIEDADGHSILDFWQGHYANILGHNPPEITEKLAGLFASGGGLQNGFTDQVQIEVAEILCRTTGLDRVRFTTSGSLATMYAVLLARAFTGRKLVMKVGGGWHGGQPWGLVGVEYHDNLRGHKTTDETSHFRHVDTEGLPEGLSHEVLVTRFNDVQMLRDHFRRHGDRLACFMVEPFVGAGGGIPAAGEYLREARALTEKHGALLVCDEVISGYRFQAGPACRLYGVLPDLVTLAKVMGGGMPVAAVAGRGRVMQLAARTGSVRFSGGTYSGHPACLAAAKAMLEHLEGRAHSIYPALSSLGDKARRVIEEAFASEGIHAHVTGAGNDALPGSSVMTVVFPHEQGRPCNAPEETRNPHLCDVVLSDRVLQLALLLEDVHVLHGFGALATTHTEKDLAALGEAITRAARRIRRSGGGHGSV